MDKNKGPIVHIGLFVNPIDPLYTSKSGAAQSRGKRKREEKGQGKRKKNLGGTLKKRREQE